MLLPILYVALFVIIIYRAPFFRDERLSRKFFIIVFVLKALAGIAYTHAFDGGDTTKYFDDANEVIYPSLWQNPVKYLYLTFAPNGGDVRKAIRGHVQDMGYWGDTSAYMVVRFNALVRLVSMGNFFVHAVFMAFFSLIGLVWLHRAYARAMGGATIYSIFAIFLIPSVIFWGSGVLKEGMLLFALGAFFYGCVLLSKATSLKGLVLFAVGGILIFLVRDFVFLLIVPGIFAWFITVNEPHKAKWVFPFVYLLFFAAGCLFPVFNGQNFLEIISYKQNQFLEINEGNTQINVRLFEPVLVSLFTNLPGALKNCLAGPFLISPDSMSHLVVMLENALLFLLALAIPFLSGKPRWHPLTIWFLFFSLSLLILIGFIVPNVGAIVRYRSLALPFLFLFLYSGKR